MVGASLADRWAILVELVRHSSSSVCGAVRCAAAQWWAPLCIAMWSRRWQLNVPTPCAIDTFIRAIVVYFIKESPHGLYPILVELRKATHEARRLGSICLPHLHA